ncbi:MAG: ferritin [Elusimicrobiota bacterium]|jgi:ferritin|nr:ferritin [Elusimicrobiota bacterium]
MANKKIIKQLNHQINRELFSAYLYMAMGAYCDEKGLRGFSNWFIVQVKEELEHAKIIYDYVNDLGEKIELLAIEAPAKSFNSILDLFEKTLTHEKSVTKLIWGLVSLAKQEKDYATENFLTLFVKEQIEEESNVRAIIDKLKFIKDSGAGILKLDSEFALRKF